MEDKIQNDHEKSWRKKFLKSRKKTTKWPNNYDSNRNTEQNHTMCTLFRVCIIFLGGSME